MPVQDNHVLNFSEENVNFNKEFLPLKTQTLPIHREH